MNINDVLIMIEARIDELRVKEINEESVLIREFYRVQIRPLLNLKNDIYSLVSREERRNERQANPK